MGCAACLNSLGPLRLRPHSPIDSISSRESRENAQDFIIWADRGNDSGSAVLRTSLIPGQGYMIGPELEVPSPK
jgi:hypothetical protein